MHNLLSPSQIKQLFALRDDLTHLNNGSAGACPKAILEKWQEFQMLFESHPDKHVFVNAHPEAHDRARQALAEFIGAASADIALVPNVTIGLNGVIKSLPLEAGDEVLTTNHIYSAVAKTYQYYALEKGFSVRSLPIPVPLSTPTDFVQWFLAQVTPQTRVIHLDHITSASALVLPIAEICAYAREHDILTVIDGGHAPGQLDLNLNELGADFYAGNLHKWCLTPKGVGVLYVHPSKQKLMKPLIVSHGWRGPEATGTAFRQWYEWLGTIDYSRFLVIPEAIDFMTQHHWDEVKKRCHQKVVEAFSQIPEITQWQGFHSDAEAWNAQMIAFRMDKHISGGDLLKKLYEDYNIWSWVGDINGEPTFRLSVQAYVSDHELARFYHALDQIYNA